MSDELNNNKIDLPQTDKTPPWSRMTRYLAVVFVCLFFIWLLGAVRPLLGSLVISALLAYIMNPSVARLTHHIRIRRGIAVTFIYILGLLLITGSLSLSIPYLIEQGRILSEELVIVGRELERRIALQQTLFFVGFRFPLDDLLEVLQTPSVEFLDLERIFNVLQSVSQNFAWVLVVLVTTYYLLLDWPRLRDWLLSLPPPSHTDDIRRLYEEVKGIWWSYLRGQISLMILIAILNSIGGAIIGLPGAVALGMLGGFLDIVPSVGPLIAMIIAMAVGFIQGSTYLPLSNTLFALLVLAVYGGIQTLENVWLRPRIMSQNVKIHPAVVFVAIMASLVLSTILVTLLIIPLIGTFMVLGRYLRCRIFGLDPWALESPLQPVKPAEPIRNLMEMVHLQDRSEARGVNETGE
ncbi:MAG: AI-2E family transporter [Anaerolineae bacterium]|nr:AI-2E family transporter [Anaerolineae bacterium]